VFNICLESIVAAEVREMAQLEKRPKLDVGQPDIKCVPVKSNSRTLLSGSIVDGLLEVDSSSTKSDDGSKSAKFFDAEERSVSFRLDSKIGGGFTSREGARCPVLNASLLVTGDQVYAPYLQRPSPLTDDMIAQRQMMLAQLQGSKASATVRQRLEITQRLQRPKLLSDMQAFKAANPGAVFQDFISW
jgi:hypothetical protein